MADREDRRDYETFIKKGSRSGLGTFGDIFENLKLNGKKEE
jgi:hypothetical protein